MRIATWMERSGVAFGTSGARGLVTAMTDAVCFAYTVGYLKHLAVLGEFAPGRPVAIAGDLRPSTPRIVRACIAAIRHMGVSRYGVAMSRHRRYAIMRSHTTCLRLW